MRRISAPDLAALGVALKRGLSVVIFGVLPIVLFVATFAPTVTKGTFAYDFRGDLYDSARAILHGHNPYRYAFLQHLAAERRAGRAPSTTFAVPVYPAPALLSMVPLALLPFRAAGLLFTALSIAAMVGALWLMDVRDWRCYGAAFLSFPLLHSLRLGQLNEFLVLGIAVAWRWRQRAVTPSVAVAIVVALKLFLWPLWVFVLLLKRYWAAVAAVGLVAVSLLLGWAIIDFHGLTKYPQMLSDLSSVVGRAGVSYVSVGDAVGLSSTLSAALALLVTAALLILAAFYARRRGQPNRALGLTVVAALTASPVVWPHYLTLVFVPIALLSPALSPLWLVPLLAWIAPVEQTHGELWKMAPYLAIEAITVCALCLWPDRTAATQDRSGSSVVGSQPLPAPLATPR